MALDYRCVVISPRTYNFSIDVEPPPGNFVIVIAPTGYEARRRISIAEDKPVFAPRKLYLSSVVLPGCGLVAVLRLGREGRTQYAKQPVHRA